MCVYQLMLCISRTTRHRSESIELCRSIESLRVGVSEYHWLSPPDVIIALVKGVIGDNLEVFKFVLKKWHCGAQKRNSR